MNNKELDKIKDEMTQKKVAVIKAAVKLTLELIDCLEKQHNDIQNKIKILKHDLFDLKDGRLDRILERQLINNSIKEISAVIIEKTSKETKTSSPWYIDYKVTVRLKDGILDCEVNNSVTRMHASGTYKLSDDSIRYL